MITLTYTVRRAARELSVTEGWGNKIVGEARKKKKPRDACIYIYITHTPPKTQKTKPHNPNFI